MSNPEYPKLHLPPWFQDWGGEELTVMKGWTCAGFIELENGDIVRPTFITLWRIESDLKNSGKPYWSADEDLIVLEQLSIEHIRSLLPLLADAGAFNAMRRYDSIQWEDVD